MGCTNGAALSMTEASAPHGRTAAPTDIQLRALCIPLTVFVLVSIVDTISSVYMLLHGVMEEYNPLMRWVWQAGGVPGFVGVKALLTVLPVWLFDRLKREHYRLVYGAVWVTLVGYAVIYGILFCIANH